MLDAGQQDVAQRRRQLARVAFGGHGDELLAVERVALRAREDRVDDRGRDAATGDRRELLGDLLAREGMQLEQLHAARAIQLGQEGAQGVAAVQRVGAVRRDDHDRLPPQGLGEKRE